MVLFTVVANAQQKVIQLYKGAAPGSESWDWDQKESADNMYHSNAIYNVVHPTLTVYLPEGSHAPTGIAVIICPGGGFHSLSIDHEGYEVGRWLQKMGITAFLLEYRLMHITGTDPYKQENADRTNKAADKEKTKVISMAIADGRAAIAYVRSHATEYGISPSKIGIMGFSAGGTIAAAAAYGYTPVNKPNFVAPIYAYFPPEMQNNVPADAPPMFIAAATDDTFNLQSHSLSLYKTWMEAKHSAELHIFSKGSHGFGMKKQGFESDNWTDDFMAWMKTEGLLKK
jgi:acetyl esterase/lipase